MKSLQRPAEIKIDQLPHNRYEALELPPMSPAALVLGDGRVFHGHGIGAPGLAMGEIVFNTSMTGYQEIITDPSYRGQLVTFTYPHIGNYGIQAQDGESNQPQVSGIIVRSLCRTPVHEHSVSSLGAYMARNGITGIEGVDTRALVRHLRGLGVQPAAIATFDSIPSDAQIEAIRAEALAYAMRLDLGIARSVGIRRPYELEGKEERRVRGEQLRVVVYDFGMKQGIARQLQGLGCKVYVVPASFSFEALENLKPDGILLSNGPGDPRALSDSVALIQRLLGRFPIFGICLGHQLLSLALGAKIEKMRFGHRGANHPVLNIETGEVEITSQNHGYTVLSEGLPTSIKVTHINLNDQTIEGISALALDAFSVQYHPEACPGPHDAHVHFHRFLEIMRQRVNQPLVKESQNAKTI